ncbi:MAG TPA: hypothetical protein VMT52_09525 [Planctomycetota bacterium]|nr:hypothetical protein [Planctomycetota bacterium]
MLTSSSRSLVLLVTFAAAGCVAPRLAVYQPGLDRPRFTRVNFRPDGGVLHAANYLAHPSTIPVGSPAQVTQWTDKEIRLTVNGSEYRMVPVGLDAHFPTDEAGMNAFLEKYFVDRREDLAIESLGPVELKDKVLSGVQMRNMTKRQVYACLGPPLEVGDGNRALPLTYQEILQNDKWVYPERTVALVPVYATFYFGDGILQDQKP